MLPQVQENLGLPTRATGSAEQAILSSKASPLNAYKSFALKSQSQITIQDLHSIWESLPRSISAKSK